MSDEQLEKIRVTLEEILQQTRQQNRLRYHRDFSYPKLIGAVAQLLVLGMTFWAVVGLAEIKDLTMTDGTLLKLLGGVLLQLLALTFFFLDQQER
jgi:hypothetical protein